MNFADKLAELSAAEWRRARQSRMLAARAVQQRHDRAVLVWAARRANHELIARLAA